MFSLFIWLHQIVAVALGIVSLCCGMWDLVLQPGIQPRPPALRVRSAGHWTAWDVPVCCFVAGFVSCACANVCVCLRRLLKDSPHFFFGAGTSQGYSFPNCKI